MKPGALVIGASGDIGKAICHRLENDGWEVMKTTRSSSQEQAANSIPLDLLNPDSVESAFEQWKEATGDPCCIIQAGGTPSSGMIATLPEQEARAALDLHAMSALIVARAAARVFIPQHRGHLLLISSLAALRPNPGQAAYAAAKGAVESLVRALAREWGGKNIRVNAIAPGYIESRAIRDMNPPLLKDKLAQLPVSRPGTAEEVAALASFLSSPQASYITGQILRIDGGASI